MNIRRRAKANSKNGYAYQVRISYMENGVHKRHEKGGFETLKEAKAYGMKVEKELSENGYLKKECKLTLLQVFNEFMDVGSSKYQHNTLNDTKLGFNYVKNSLGNMPIVSIRYLELQKYFNSRKNCSLPTNNKIKKALNRVFNYAVKTEYIETNPMDKVDVEGTRPICKREQEFYTSDQFAKIINALGEDKLHSSKVYQIALYIAYFTGLRISEVLALEKGDVDLENDLITPRRKLNYTGLKGNELFVTDKLKSKMSAKPIPLAKPLKDILIDWFGCTDNEVIVSNAEGGYIIPRVLEVGVKNAMKRNGVNMEFRFHMIRHTFATNIVMSGCDLKTAQELMRHSKIDTTMSIYTHITEQKKKEALDNAFNGHWVKIGSKEENESSSFS